MNLNKQKIYFNANVSRRNVQMLKESEDKRLYHMNKEEEMKQFFKLNQLSFPLFISNNELCVISGQNLNIYNPFSGSLIKVLQGPESKVVNFWQNPASDANHLLSCDMKGNIYDWDYVEGTFKNVFSLSKHLKYKYQVVCCTGHESFSLMTLVFSLKNSDEYARILLIPTNLPDKFHTKSLSDGVLPSRNGVAISYDGMFIALVKFSQVVIIKLDKTKTIEKRYHGTGFFQITSVTFHPKEQILALARNDGMINLWYQFMEIRPVKVPLHWHTLSPGDLHFSPSGAYLFSGGVECVAVQWNLKSDNEKSFLPRLGMPICSLAGNSNMTLLAVLHQDESISIINIQEMRLLGAIEKLANHVPINNYPPLSTGLIFHKPTATLAKNGRTGHLQFFDPETTRVMYNMDITLMNLLTAERIKKVVNPEVTKAAMSDDGLWLVTSEACQLTKSLNEIIFKFWHFEKENQEWAINTYITMPHSKTVNSISFCPPHKRFLDEVCASCSEEGKVKIWRLVSYKSTKETKVENWGLSATLEFRRLPATASNYSPDGSLLAVAFGSAITLWNVEDDSLVGTLSQSFLNKKILNVSFNYGEFEGSYLVSRSRDFLCSWDLISCSLRWKININSSCLAVDKRSSLMALCCKSKVYFFKATSSKPIQSINSAKVLCAIFLPDNNAEPNNSQGQNISNSLLHCFSIDQDFFTLALSPDENVFTITESEKQVLSSKQSVTDGESKQVSALIAKSHKRLSAPTAQEEEETNVTLMAPSINALIKDLHDLKIHTLSFAGLTSHLNSFLPDLSPDDATAIKGVLNYRTIKETKDEDAEQEDKMNQRRYDDASFIKKLHEINYTELVHNAWKT